MNRNFKEYTGDTDTSIFAEAIGKPCTIMNEKPFDGKVVGVLFIDGSLHYHCLFPYIEVSKTGRKKNRNYGAVWEHQYVKIN